MVAKPMRQTKVLNARVAIVLLNWNGWKDTIACIESILATDHTKIGIFVCDNASTDDSLSHIRKWAASRPIASLALTERQGNPGSDWPPQGGSLGTLTLLNTGGNLGFAGGCNMGLRYALMDDYDFFWLLNNDTEIAHSSLPALLERMTRDSNIGMCGSTLVYAEQPNVVQNFGGGSFSRFKGRGEAFGQGCDVRKPIDKTAFEPKMHFVSGASMLVSRAFLTTVGLMDEGYFLYFEELDWAERARSRFILGYAPESIVRHKVGASIGTNDFGQSSPLSTYFMTRSRVRFCWRFHKVALPFIIFDLLRKMLQAACRGNWSLLNLICKAALQLPLPSVIGNRDAK
jgi:GT2 family glycosyltransferase